MKSILSLIVACVLTITSHENGTLSYYSNYKYQNLDSLAKIYNNQGVDFAMEGDYEKASELFLKSLRLRETILNFPKARLANGYINLATLKFDMSFVDSALFYYKKAESLLLSMENPPSSTLGIAYYAYGNCIRYKQDYKTAIAYIRKGINLLSKDSLANSSHLVLATLKLSAAYREAGMFYEALNAALNAKKLSEQFNRVYYSNANSAIGLIYLDLKDYKNAVIYFENVGNLINKGERWRPSDLMALYCNLGTIHHHINHYELADYYFTKGLELAELSTSFSPQLCILLRNYAMFQRYLGDIDRAENYFLKSLNLNAKDPTTNNILELPLIDFYSPLIAIQCLEGLGLVYHTRFEKKSENIFVQKSFEYFSKAIAIMDEQRASIFDDGDKLYIDDIYHTLYLNTIKACFSFSGHIPEAIEYAFKVSSKAKAAVLNQALQQERGLTFSGVPQELINQERELRLRVSTLYERYYEEKLKPSPLIKQLQSIEGRIFDAQREHNRFLSFIEGNYPKYYALKYDTTSVSVSDIQAKLKPSQVLIDYIITDSILFSFAVTKNSFSWESEKLKETFNDSLEIFLNEVNPSSFESLNRFNLEQFAKASYYLYGILLKPYEAQIKERELIVVPHQQLSSIPWAALTTNSVTNLRGYYSLPYLVKSTPISYSPSTKLFYTAQVTRPSHIISSISYAPSYDYTNDNDYFSTLSYRQNLGDLPGAEKEAEALSSLLKGKLVAGKEATEKHFKEHAGDYTLLHLAMHTHVDEQNPLYSKLIFSASPDTTDDGFLNLYEVYGLKLNAKLVIISACRSGDGNLAKGEGLLSLARGYQYAGVPSLVAAQWRVDDFSGSEIIIEFVKNLCKGMSKARALQKAQLDFLNTADPLRSHPYFWASYQIIGDQSPIFHSALLRIILWVSPLFFLCIVMVGAWGYVKRKSKGI